MPAEVDSAQEASCGGIENFVEDEQEKFKGFVKVKTAVGGNLYWAFYTIAECARYLPIGSKDLLESIENHSEEYKLLDHIRKIKEAFNDYGQKSFYKCDNFTAEKATQKSAYAEEFKQNVLCLDIYDIDNNKDDFDQYLCEFSDEQEDWFDKLRKHDNKQLYHLIVGSYLATISPKISLNGKSKNGNNLEHQQLIDLANHLFPHNPLCMSFADKYYKNEALVSFIDSCEEDQILKQAAEKWLVYDDKIKLFCLPKDKEGFQSKIQQYTSRLTTKQSAQVISICTPDKFTEIESSYYHYGRQHFSALIPSQRFKQFNSEITGLQIDDPKILHQTPSSSPAPQNTEIESKEEAEKINNKLLKQLNESKEKYDQEAKNKARKEFNSPSKYSGLGLKVELVKETTATQGEVEYKYKIIDYIEDGLASAFYKCYKDKNLHIVFKCKPEDHDQFITDIRNLKRIKSDKTKSTEYLFQIWSGIEGKGNAIVGGKSILDSNYLSVHMLYGPPHNVIHGKIERKFYTKMDDQGKYKYQSYQEYQGIGNEEAPSLGR